MTDKKISELTDFGGTLVGDEIIALVKGGITTKGLLTQIAVPPTRTVNGQQLDGDISLSASNVGAVPTTRTVNNKELSSDISLSYDDVGAAFGRSFSSGPNSSFFSMGINTGSLIELLNFRQSTHSDGLTALVVSIWNFAGDASDLHQAPIYAIDDAMARNIVGTYDNGSGGVGATITTSSDTLAIYPRTDVDGNAPATNGMLLAVVGQTAPEENGIYVVSGVGSTVVLTRHTSYDVTAEIHRGDFFQLQNTSSYTYIVMNSDTPVMGTDAITFKVMGIITEQSFDAIGYGATVFASDFEPGSILGFDGMRTFAGGAKGVLPGDNPIFYVVTGTEGNNFSSHNLTVNMKVARGIN